MINDKIISFDFDGTLDHHFNGSMNPYREEIQNICKQLLKHNEVHIITKRFGPGNGVNMNEHLKVYDLAKKLGISVKNVHFTNRRLKTEELTKNNVYLHFDDDQYELSIYRIGICKVVNVENPKWKGEIPND